MFDRVEKDTKVNESMQKKKDIKIWLLENKDRKKVIGSWYQRSMGEIFKKIMKELMISSSKLSNFVCLKKKMTYIVWCICTCNHKTTIHKFSQHKLKPWNSFLNL